jgi:non-ribosomal peptide synthase protein (TIGR01720 family)
MVKAKEHCHKKNTGKKLKAAYEPFKTDKTFTGIIKAKDVETKRLTLNEVQTKLLLNEVPKVYHTEINDILLCALALTICEYGNSEKIVIGLEGHGREDINESIDTSRTVGWFTSLYPLLLDLKNENNLSDSIKSVKEQIRKIPDKGIGYGVLKYLNNEKYLNTENKENNLTKNENWDIVFNYLGQLDNVVSSGKWLSGADEPSGSSTSEESAVRNKIAVNGRVHKNELTLNWSYSTLHFENETIEKLIEKYQTNLESIISHCIKTQKETGEIYTPSDYSLGDEINFEELDKFLDDDFKGKPRREAIEGIYRLSGLQQGMLFHGLYDENSGAYIEQLSCDLTNPNLDVIKKSWEYVLRNHSILRSGFYSDEFSIPVQCVYKNAELPVEILDFSELNSEEQNKAIKEYEETDRYKGFDFKTAPLMRICLMKLSKEKYRMLWTSHHILFDGWSMPILMEEFLTAYENLISGKELQSKEADRYEDYIRYIERVDKEKQENYWRGYMQGVEQSTLLPFIGTTKTETKELVIILLST